MIIEPPCASRPTGHAEIADRARSTKESPLPLMFLNGTAMAGGADHHLVGGAPLVTATTTAPRYRFHAVDGRYPALEDVGEGGAAVVGEVYDLSYEQLREVLLPGEPDGLELGVIELADGTGSLAMILRREYPQLPDLTDISEPASWRAYRAQT